MMKKQFNGFTMIEVALVFGIAGLIFLMTFIALPTLQRQSRDAQRESDMAKFVELAKKFQTNNRGALPLGAENLDIFERDYLGDDFVDPLGAKYNISTYDCGGSEVGKPCTNELTTDMVRVLNENNFEANGSTLRVVAQAKCAGDEATGVVAAPKARKMAVLYKLEGGGIHCENT